MTDNHWGGILESGNTRQIAADFQKKLAGQLARVDSADALQLLYGIRAELVNEISAGRRIPEEIEKLLAALATIRVADELQSARERFLQLAAELYRTRSSVSSTFSHGQSFYDRLITTAFDHAVEIQVNEFGNRANLPCAVLVSGELGRAESLTGSRSSFFLIYSAAAAADCDALHEYAMSFMAILSVCFPAISRNLHRPSGYWFGSDTQWRETVAQSLLDNGPDNRGKSGGGNFALFLATVADMRFVCGDGDFGKSIIATGRKLLADCQQTEQFWRLAKETATMPVALGVFGRFKTVRTGENKGKINLKEMAIDPLAAAVRLLAIASNSLDTTFTGRMKTILATGSLGVSLADRLLIAYQDFMRERIRLELAGSNGSEGLFFDPELLDEASRERLRNGLDDITTLQRLVHQQLVEVTPG